MLRERLPCGSSCLLSFASPLSCPLASDARAPHAYGAVRLFAHPGDVALYFGRAAQRFDGIEFSGECAVGEESMQRRVAGRAKVDGRGAAFRFRHKMMF